MRYVRSSLSIIAAVLILPMSNVCAAPLDAVASALVPHKATYDVNLVATHSGSQIINIRGKMVYEWKPTCDAWATNHQFQLSYEYADAPGMKIVSNFSTYETQDGKNFNFSSRRQRDGELYQDLRGHADIGKSGGKVTFSKPEGLNYELGAGALFPVSHTAELIRRANKGDKFYSAEVYDGSDEDGPVEINTFIGKQVKAKYKDSKTIDASLLDGKAWNIRMAVFPIKDQEEESDYEMNLVFHENGIISDMLIEYDDFSVTQKLQSLEKIKAVSCDNGQ
jgi:hypothetical protein